MEQDEGLSPRAAPAQIRLPALALAGLMAGATALGHGLGQFWQGEWVPWEPLAAVALLSALALRAAGVEIRSIARRARPWLALLALAALGRAAAAPTGTIPVAHLPHSLRSASGVIAGRAIPDRRRVAQRDRTQWRVKGASTARGTEAARVSMETAEGAVSAGDVVAILPTAETRRRARSRDLPRRERPLPRAPLADEVIRLRAGAPGVPWAQPLRSLRASGVERIDEMRDAPARGLLAALLFGDTSRLPYGVADLFTRTGTRHMLALSGLHVGLLGALIALPLSRALCFLVGFLAALAGSRWRPSPALPGAALALAFIPLAGQGAPASRAATALALTLMAPALRRRTTGLNLVAAALLLEIALDPLAPLRAGVQLSYLATAALIAAASPASQAALALLPGEGRVKPTWPSGRRRSAWLRVGLERCLRTVTIALATSVVASVATLPIVWTNFGEFSPVGIVATPLAFPPLVLLVAGGWAWLGLTSWAPLGRLAGPFCEDVLASVAHGMLKLLAWADRAPWSPLALPERSLLWLGAGSLCTLWGVRTQAGAGSRPSGGGFGSAIRWGAAFYGAALLPLAGGSSLPGVAVRARGLEAHVMDVGNGTAVLVRAPGEPTWIVDAGSRDRSAVTTGAVAPVLRALDAGRLRVSLSHDDSDHAGALPWIVRRYSADLWVGPRPSTREAPGLGPDPLDGARQVPLRRGSQVVTREGAALQIRAVHGGDFPGNEGSSMLDVRWSEPGLGSASIREWRLILSGDAEGHGLSAMLSSRQGQPPALEPGPVDALLLPHHGSETPHLGWLLDHLQPREVWVSGGAPPIGLEELERRGIPVRCTSEVGGFVWSSPPLSEPAD